jgi:hypothetical protein
MSVRELLSFFRAADVCRDSYEARAWFAHASRSGVGTNVVAGLLRAGFRASSWRNMLSRLLLFLAVALAAFCSFVALRSGSYRLERSLVMAASPLELYQRIEDLREWPRWSPWEELDPHVERSFAGPPSGAGASFVWRGNRQIGEGSMAISEASPPTRVRYLMVFEQPWRATMQHDISVAPHGGAGTRSVTVTWVLSGQHRFWAKLFTLFFGIDERLGKDQERGLARLKLLVEQPKTAGP